MDPSYDGVAGPAFAEQWGLRLKRWRKVREEVLFPHIADVMGKVNAREACDLGCGDGAATHLLHPSVEPSATVTVVDVNRTLLDRCESRHGEWVRPVLMDLRAPHKLECTFDLVQCVNVLMMLDDEAVKHTTNWLAEQLSRNGTVVLSIVHPQWTFAANQGDEGPVPDEAAFPIGWEGVDAMLYYRSEEWYRDAFRARNLHIARETVLTLPAGRSFGSRFDGKVGWPVFWVTVLRHAS